MTEARQDALEKATESAVRAMVKEDPVLAASLAGRERRALARAAIEAAAPIIEAGVKEQMVQPIETAPKDGSWIIGPGTTYRWKAYKPGAPKELLAKKGRWQRSHGYGFENSRPPPSHWSPLLTAATKKGPADV